MPEERLKRKGVQLAVHATERHISNLGDTFYIQPKLNGERCRVVNFQGSPILLSSYEIPFEFLDQIKREIKEIWDSTGVSIPFDGEIYLHGWERERIDSALRRKVNYNPEVEHLEFHIFDCAFVGMPQGIRLQVIQNALSSYPKPHLKLVPTYIADKHSWAIASDVFLLQGYEGSVLRNPVSNYTEGKHVNVMLKYKPTEEDDYTIVGCNEAISQDGELKGMLGSFLVQDSDDKVFSVGAGKLSHQERIDLWKIRLSLTGKTLLVKHGKIYTSDNFPTCAVAVRIKDL